ncbi:hypothetical protein ACJZ2D_016480 [Fusarium nematophilum]
MYEPEVIKRGIDVDDWGKTTAPNDLTIRWHQPSPPEIDFAVELFASQTKSAKEQLEQLMSDDPPVSRTGKNKEWSDEVSRLMQQIRLVTSGMATMFDPERAAGIMTGNTEEDHDVAREDDDEMMIDEDPLAEVAEDEELRPQFRYKAGYVLRSNDPAYCRIHDLREELGHLLTKTHSFLNENQEDDVNSFTALYAAYRTWITDVGIERSAHPLERHVRLYKSDIAAFKIKGLRKVYPRPLLIKRAEAYQLLRRKHNASSRQKSELDKRLLLDLAESSLSLYADVRRVAQSALDPSLKSLIGSKPLVIPVILEKFRKAIETNDHDRIKGGMYTLLFTSLLRTLLKDWRFAPEAMRLYIETAGIDKPSIQNLGSSALYTLIDFGKPFERMIIVDDPVVDTIKPSGDVSAAIETRHQIDETGEGGPLEDCHAMCHLRSEPVSPVPAEFIDLVAHGTNDPHPGLRGYYLNAFTSIFTAVDMRAVYGHEYRNYLLEKEVGDRNRVQVAVKKGDAEFTRNFLEAFKQPEDAAYMVDADHPGWLVWGKKFTAYRAKPLPFNSYDEVETRLRDQMGFRMSNVYLLMHVFDLMHYGKTAVTLDDVKELTKEVFGDGNDKHQHRATSEIVGALLAGSSDDPPGDSESSLGYWLTCLHLILDSKDPRRSHEIVDALKSFRLDMSSNAAFKESSKVQLLEFIVADGGWHFRHEKPILDDFLAHIDHPYKAVREAIGRVLSVIYKTRYHESFENVSKLLEENKAASSIGIRPYQPTEEFAATIKDVFDRLEKWRHERTPGQQTPSSYTSGSKTVLTWLDCTLSSHECIQLVPFFPSPFMEELLHMMDVKEDPGLMRLAYHVYRHLPNIPFQDGEDADFIDALIRIGKTSTSWHQRLRALVNMQVIYFRRIFLTRSAQREALFAAVPDMLGDPQLEVRSYASTTLAGMIRCSPRRIRDPMIAHLKARFEDELQRNPMPKRGRHLPGTDTPVDVHKQITRRHAAVLGLGALIEAFPYATPPPEWMPEVLATLARRAAADPGVVGKATKTILSEFKKTRQESWTVDQKYFTAEQLEDLEGVFWKSYFT